MYGAILGDIIGSTYEFDEMQRKDFELFPDGSEYTDDTITTLATASALLETARTGRNFERVLIQEMKRICRMYPDPMGAYGCMFHSWIYWGEEPYYSCGNGSAMRCSPCALIATSLEQARSLARRSASITHNHPEGIKGAEATAAAIYLARTGSSKDEIRDYIRQHFYPLQKTLDEIRPDYGFHGTCQRSVPESIQAFLESTSFEDAIRNTISLGGDADTMGAITGSIAWAYYGRDGLTPDMEELLTHIELPDPLQRILDDFESYIMTM